MHMHHTTECKAGFKSSLTSDLRFIEDNLRYAATIRRSRLS